mgnify:CR=1 FL=1
MSRADQIFIDMCKDVLENGFSSEGQKVRAVWESDGAPAHTIKKFGVVNRKIHSEYSSGNTGCHGYDVGKT